MKKLCWILLLFGMFAMDTQAFSPYENYLLSGKPTHVGLLARAKPGQDKVLSERLSRLCGQKENNQLEQSGILNPVAFKREIQGEQWILIYFQYSGEKQYLTAAQTFEAMTAELNNFILPHPRAVRYGSVWLQMEWINYIHGLNVDREPTDRLSMVTTIRPEKESEYRTLHQTVWPGVVDQMIRGNNRNFSIFLAEIGEQLYEFFYLEYMGSNPEKDNRMNNEDPINQRWWAQTGPCQMPLPGEKDIWAPMFQITKPTVRGTKND